MPTVEENLRVWSEYNWAERGNEWNQGYGGTQNAWEWAVYPRIRAFVPAKHILEIAPGRGVWTEYLRPLAERMTLVDLVPECIEACKAKFGRRGMDYIANDGRTFPGVATSSIDFVFSWHSLVHCDHEVMRSYVGEPGRVMRPGAFGLIHHSDFESVIDPATGQAPFENFHWRGRDMSAAKFRADCASRGLHCVYQELVPWGYPTPTDAFSVFTKPMHGNVDRPTIVDENRTFWEQVQTLAQLKERYQRTPGDISSPHFANGSLRNLPVG